MGMFDFITNPINDAFHAVVDSNPITSGISNAIHSVGESTGINDIVDKAAPIVTAAAAIYLTGGALAPEAAAALESEAASAGLTTDEYATLVANSAPVDSAMAGADTSTSLLDQAASAYNALPSVAKTALTSTGINALLGTAKKATTPGTTSSPSASGLSSLPTTATSIQESTPKASLVKGSQIASPLSSSYNIPVETSSNTSVNPLSLTEIQNAASGGIIHMATGGDLPMSPKQLRGQTTQHADLFGMHGTPITGIPHLANGGEMMFQDRTLPEGHNPKFFSEGGLNAMENRYVTGDGDGTSDSIPAMLANGEFVIPADVVSGLGNGSNDAGAEILNAFMETIRDHKQKHDKKHLPPDSKGPLTYLSEAEKKVRT